MKLLFAILLAAGIAAIGLGLGPLSLDSKPLGFSVAAAGALTCLAIAIWVPGFMTRREERQKQDDLARAEEMANRIAMTGESFDLSDTFRSFLITLTITAFPAITFFALPTPLPPPVMVFGSIFTVLAFFAWASFIPRLQAPALSLSRTGLKSALHGSIPWEEVKGVNLSQVTSRGAKIHTLEFLIPNIASFRPQMHPSGRLFRSLAFGRIRTMLRFSVTPRQAAFTEHLARGLLKRATGRSGHWIPDMPGFSEELEETEKFLEELESLDVRADPQRALEIAQRHEAALKRIKAQRK